MQDDNKMDINLDRDPEIARLIINTAEGLAKGPPPITPTTPEGGQYFYKRLSPEHVKEAANLVLLALSLVKERDK